MSGDLNALFQNFDNEINLENDFIFINSKDILKIFCRILVKHLDIFLRIYTVQNTLFYSKYQNDTDFDLDAGDILNKFFCMSSLVSNPNSTYLINDEEFNRICITFIEQIKHFPTLARFTIKIDSNPINNIFDCCKHFIIPARLLSKSIPISEKENVLRKWFSVVFIIPMLKLYNSRYSEVYLERIQSLQTFYDKFVTRNEGNINLNYDTIKRIQNLKENMIDTFVSEIDNNRSTTAMTFKTYILLMLLASCEIIPKYCGSSIKFIRENINNSFTGTWIDPMDNLYIEQIQKIGELIKILSN